jgi:superfamily II DNA or RNA helicase
MTLRPYQEEAISQIGEAVDRGVRKQLGVAATGLGKTIIFSSLAERMAMPTLILAHRDELISQAADKLRQVWPGADIGVIKAGRNEIDHQVVVGSVQTLARQSRRDQVPFDKFGLIIIDEAHHSKADSYLNIIEHFHAGEQDGPLLLGVTATPDRGDGKGLADIFDEITFNYDMLWGIRSGYLSDLRGMRVHLDVDFSKVKVSRGDYDAGQAGRMLEDADAPTLVADAWMKYADDRKTLVFTPTIATAEMVAVELIGRGVRAASLSGETPLDERRDILARYAAGEIRVVSNCAVLTEGFDDPGTSCIIVARPTKSRALYTQMIGRGTRRHPDKTDCLVIDVVGASATHSLVTIPSLFGIKKENPFEGAEKTVGEALQEQVEEEVRRGELKATEADLFRKVLDSPIAWVHFNNAHSQTSYLCSLGSREAGSVMIEPIPYDVTQPSDVPTRYHTYVQWDDEYAPTDDPALRFHANGSAFKTLITNVELEMAQGVGEDFIRKNGASALTDRNAAWRKKPPTQKQIDAAEKWRLPVDPAWDAGELSAALSAHIEAKKNRSRNRPKPPPGGNQWRNKR